MEQHNTKLAEAVTKVMNSIYNQYQGLQVKPIPKYEDEDFTVEVTIPVHLPINKVEQSFHKECIKVEDEYDVFILPRVVYEKQ